MGVTCWILGHAAADEGRWNEGYYFARCKKCSCDLIRTSGEFLPVPLGYQVKWKPGFHRHAIASDFRRNLPLMPEEPRRWRVALHRIGRGVLFLPGPEVKQAAQEREPAGGLPHLVLIGMLAALGLASRLVPHRR